MKCPLLSIYDHERYGSQAKSMPDCIKWDCAWWNPGEPGCSIKAMITLLEGIRGELFALDTTIAMTEKKR
jgi:hypothetical protein